MLMNDFLLGLDAVEFSRSIGIEPDEWQAKVLRSDSKRILLNCSRQSGKSTTCATLALHQALFTPKSLILLTSPSLRQSQELFRKIRDEINTMDIKPQLLEDNKLSVQFDNYSRIVSLPADGGTVRGYSGVSLLLVDEAAQVSDEFFSTLLPMLIVSKGKLIAMSTPFGKRGFFYENWISSGDEWERIEVTAHQCPRMTKEQLEQQRRSMGEQFFRQEFMCEFADTIEQTFSTDSIQKAFSDAVEPLEL